MQDMVVNDEITTGQRLAAQYGDCRDAVIAESAKRSELTRMLAREYDASNYAWRSDGHVGNTLTEIREIRANGFPLPKSRNATSGEMHFRGFQYENEEGFLKGSRPYTIKKKDEDVEDYEAIDFLYLEPQAVQEKYLNDLGYAEVVHNNHGRGFLLGSTEELSKVFFMELRGSTPAIHHGANIRWVKKSNLL
jgi:hypothetical protein